MTISRWPFDKYLETVPDEPNVNGLTPGGCTEEARASNSLLDQTKRARPSGRGAGGLVQPTVVYMCFVHLTESDYKVVALAMKPKIF